MDNTSFYSKASRYLKKTLNCPLQHKYFNKATTEHKCVFSPLLYKWGETQPYANVASKWPLMIDEHTALMQ